jgi:hypothetical protein
MSGILDFLKEQITPDTVNKISAEIGEDPAKTREAIDASVPLIAGAISTQEAATATGDAAGQPTMFGGLADIVTRGAGGGMLDSILGGAASSTQTEIAQKSGIEPQKIMRILTMLAPIVLSAYSRYKQAPPASPNPSRTAEKGNGGILGDIIDRVT